MVVEQLLNVRNTEVLHTKLPLTSPLGFLLVESFSFIEGLTNPYWMSDLAAAFSLNNAYLGIAICNLKSSHKDYPPQVDQTFNYSRPQIVLTNPWLVLLVVSFTSPLGFLLVEKL